MPPLEVSLTSSHADTNDQQFLSKWFEVLRNRVFLSDRHSLDPSVVRVEASGPADWWIQVQPAPLDRCPSCGFFATHEEPSEADQVKGLRELREALLLLSMYSRIDYNGWLRGMKTRSGLRFMHDAVLPCRFGLVLSGDSTTESSFQSRLLGKVFGEEAVDNFSDEFLFSYDQLIQKAIPSQRQTMTSPIPVRLEFSQLGSSVNHDIESLRVVVDSIIALRKSKGKEFPMLRAESLELRLARHEMHPLLFEEINRVIGTGILIKTLSLPGRADTTTPDGHVDACEPLLMNIFRTQTTSVCGSSFSTIDRLELPPAYFVAPFAVSWMIALSRSTNVRSVFIQGRVMVPEVSSLSIISWAALAYALFSDNAWSEVQTLSMSGFGEISRHSLHAFCRVASSEDPFRTLKTIVYEQDSEVRLPATDLTQTNRYIADSYSNRRSKRALYKIILKVTSTEIPNSSEMMSPVGWIPQLIRFAADRLTDLAIDGANVRDAALFKWLRMCPRLENLRVTGAELSSLSFVFGCVTSLDLGFVEVSRDTLQSFIAVLAQDTKLKSLRIGQGWSNRMAPSVRGALISSLRVNQSLSYLHVFRPIDLPNSRSGLEWDIIKAHDGSFISSLEAPLSMESKLAFLHGISTSATHSAITALNSDVISQIFSYAATPRRRTVSIEYDPRSSPF